MGKRMKDPGVHCPYYCSEDPQHVYCQGVEPDNWIHMSWGSKRKKWEYKNRVCKGSYSRCAVARAKENTHP